jgi:hypothetical protein
MKSHYGSVQIALWALVVLGAAAPAPKSKEPRIALSTQLDRTAIWVGDRFHYTIKAVHDPAVEIVVDNLKKENLNLAPFVVREVAVRHGAFGANRMLTEINLLLTTYESSQVELRIPSFPLYYFTRVAGMRASSENAAESVPVPVTRIGLRSTLSGDAPRLRDSRELWQVSRLRWLGPLIVGAAGLLLLGIQLLRRLWAKSHLDIPVKKRLGRRARRRMVRDFMRQAQAIGRDSAADQQRYYGEVSQFVRSYLSESLEIDAASLTAQEVEAVLSQHGQNGLCAPVKNILERCEEVLYRPQGVELGKEWREQVQGELAKFAQLARH